MDGRKLGSQFVLGTILVIVGLVLLAETTDRFDASVILQYVPTLFVLLGLYALVTSGF